MFSLTKVPPSPSLEKQKLPVQVLAPKFLINSDFQGSFFTAAGLGTEGLLLQEELLSRAV